ncbi:MAG: nuclear transport factor 2 family protein [Reyranella sp.]|uniref:nuclear transport factor 2 family protein n=1 Tax=Reyranella sp. TaxID=1929291 RepID=UPI001AD4E684|nr:nuclear transport factor 2 family protein [Reyranella sp.]MBN9089118.1 nuclear transport factor 2 family protein [Reyranella sp.]
MSVEEDIADVLLAKAEAIVHRAAGRLDPLIHPDFVYVNAAGRSFDKAGYIDAYCTSGKIVFAEQRISELSVQAFPGVAVATFVAHDRFVIDGETVDTTYQSMCVFTGGQDGWQWVAGQTRTAG